MLDFAGIGVCRGAEQRSPIETATYSVRLLLFVYWIDQIG